MNHNSTPSKLPKTWLILILLFSLLSISCVCSGENLPFSSPFGNNHQNQTEEQSQMEVTQLESSHQPPGSPLFSDDFSDPNSGWAIGENDHGSTGYKNGVYLISADADSGMYGLLVDFNFVDVIIDVDAEQISSNANNNNDYGIMCRTKFNGDGYVLNISGDGFYSIFIVEGGVFTPLVDWTFSEAIHQGNARNHIQAVCQGTRLALYVNGELLAETNDSTYQYGEIGLSASTYVEGSTTIHFDNFTIKDTE